ncbi:hypothetical protein [Paratissierella segnis]|uniref:Uncharacterized protein n=1 Tax=Paratissierella segnis TaxID=2763679 RepID=A0A926ET66_9FIRM|nr:hypothetical protein [Paratissierella segnis]MBC8588416.1 hypothetical protein [Paratissierella segnis]
MESLVKTIELQKKRMDIYEVEEESGKTLEVMDEIKEVLQDFKLDSNDLRKEIHNLKEKSKKYREESKIHYENMNNQLAEIKSLVKYTLTEQEEQRISQMSMSELLIEMQKNVEDIKSTIHKLGGDR